VPQIQGHIQTRPKTFLDVTVSLGGGEQALQACVKVTNTSALAAEVVLR
jgi:hypothetical protein